MRNRYCVFLFAGSHAIKDNRNDRVFGFGPGLDFSYVPHQQHRAQYSVTDAQAVCDMLNERIIKQQLSKP